MDPLARLCTVLSYVFLSGCFLLMGSGEVWSAPSEVQSSKQQTQDLDVLLEQPEAWAKVPAQERYRWLKANFSGKDLTDKEKSDLANKNPYLAQDLLELESVATDTAPVTAGDPRTNPSMFDTEPTVKDYLPLQDPAQQFVIEANPLSPVATSVVSTVVPTVITPSIVTPDIVSPVASQPVLSAAPAIAPSAPAIDSLPQAQSAPETQPVVEVTEVSVKEPSDELKMDPQSLQERYPNAIGIDETQFHNGIPAHEYDYTDDLMFIDYGDDQPQADGER